MEQLNQLSEKQFQVLWAFVRGDLLANEFETWLHNEYLKLEGKIPADLFERLLSTSLVTPRAVAEILCELKEFLITVSKCKCESIGKLETFGFNKQSNQIIDPLITKYSRTPWLELRQCEICNTWWYVASDTVDDEIHFQRMSQDQAIEAIRNKVWPDVFDNLSHVWPSQAWLAISGFSCLENWQLSNNCIIE